MKKDLTELVFILDMSGSMAHLTDDTIGGFNSVLKEHNDGKGEVPVTTYVFNNESKMVHDRLPESIAMRARRTFPSTLSSSLRLTEWKTLLTSSAPNM